MSGNPAKTKVNRMDSNRARLEQDEKDFNDKGTSHFVLGD